MISSAKRRRNREARIELIKECAKFIKESKGTIRSAAEKFGVSKSWLHYSIENLLRQEDNILYKEVRVQIDTNKNERTMRGGMATKLKYEKKRK